MATFTASVGTRPGETTVCVGPCATLRGPSFVEIDLREEPEDGWLHKSYRLGKYSGVEKDGWGVGKRRRQ